MRFPFLTHAFQFPGKGIVIIVIHYQQVWSGVIFLPTLRFQLASLVRQWLVLRRVELDQAGPLDFTPAPFAI